MASIFSRLFYLRLVLTLVVHFDELSDYGASHPSFVSYFAEATKDKENYGRVSVQ
jgi:hypothetical protein